MNPFLWITWALGFVFLCLAAQSLQPKPEELPYDTAEKAKERRLRWNTECYWGSIIALYLYALLLTFRLDDVCLLAGISDRPGDKLSSFAVFPVALAATCMFPIPLTATIGSVVATGCSHTVGLALFLFFCVCQVMWYGAVSGQRRTTLAVLRMAQVIIPLISFIVAIIRALHGET